MTPSPHLPPSSPALPPLVTPPPPLPPPLLESNDKLLAILCHVSGLLGVGLILPLIVYLVKKTDSPIVAAHAKEVLNFHISLVIYALLLIPVAVLSFFLSFVLFFPVISLHAVLVIGSLVCAIFAAVKAGDGQLFRYPLTLRLVQ
ncbi:DUF4870 domain-containing protein [Opitutaceae bacterium TAV4]|nr:DUF4870 domain-containing protein [Opitutaceae bacterium TAV4]RRJ99991.1 DUF4870 domain-containing protein [Opitutaceae bacterium TAV3]